MTDPRIINMHFTQAFNERLREEQQIAAERRHRFHVQYKWTLRRLKRLDPNWKEWYDNQPERTCGEMLPKMQERIELLTAECVCSPDDRAPICGPY